ncbi:MAG TPA: heavy metal-associated domain-containing protein [Methylotenera sp.]
MNKILLAFIFSISLFSNSALAATQTLKATVNGMVCAFCAQGIEKKLRTLSQTQDVYVNLKQRIVAVELKAGQTLSNDTLKGLIKDAGYDVTAIELSEHPVAHIKAEMDAKL